MSRPPRRSKGPSPVTVSHPCVACGSEVAAGRLLCRSEWLALPYRLRAALWRSWDDGRAALSPEHQEAVADAVASITTPQPPSQDTPRKEPPG